MQRSVADALTEQRPMVTALCSCGIALHSMLTVACNHKSQILP